MRFYDIRVAYDEKKTNKQIVINILKFIIDCLDMFDKYMVINARRITRYPIHKRLVQRSFSI